MKQTRSILLFFFIFTLLSCENENFRQDEYSKKESLSISNAKKWFTKFETTENVDPLFQDLVYDWENAHESTLNDGSKAITVPILNQNRYVNYSSKQVLYLYSKNNEFTATLFDLITPSKSSQYTKRAIDNEHKADVFDLDTFGGYILKWDLEKGFVKGAKFKNGTAVTNIDVTIMTANTIESLLGSNQTSKNNVNELDEVIIINNFKNQKGGYMILRESKDQRTDSGSSAGGYIGDPRTGGGGGSASTTTAEEIEDIINDSNLTPCLKAILERLKNSTNSDIASILKKLGATNVYNVTIKMGEMKFPQDYAETVRISKNNYSITLTTDTYTGATTLFKAQSLLHELTHAYFLSIVDDYNTYPTNAPFTDFPALYQAYVNKNFPGGATVAQHEAIAEKYVDAIAMALQEYNTNSLIVMSNQVYSDLAWFGLRDTPIFKSKFKEGSPDFIRMQNRFLAEQGGRPVEIGTINQTSPVQGISCN